MFYLVQCQCDNNASDCEVIYDTGFYIVESDYVGVDHVLNVLDAVRKYDDEVISIDGIHVSEHSFDFDAVAMEITGIPNLATWIPVSSHQPAKVDDCMFLIQKPLTLRQLCRNFG